MVAGLCPAWPCTVRLSNDGDVYALVFRRGAVEDVFSATAARMSAFNAFSSILSPSWKSMARLVLPSRLELKRPERVLQRGALGEGHLHDILVRLTGADYSGVRPHRNPAPLPLLDHFGIGLLDENSDPSERLAPPITQLLDSRIDQLRGRVLLPSFESLFLILVTAFFMVDVRPSLECYINRILKNDTCKLHSSANTSPFSPAARYCNISFSAAAALSVVFLKLSRRPLMSAAKGCAGGGGAKRAFELRARTISLAWPMRTGRVHVAFRIVKVILLNS